MRQHYLGIDVGTTAVKALVVDESGSVVGDAESALEVSDATTRMVGAGSVGLVARNCRCCSFGLCAS